MTQDYIWDTLNNETPGWREQDYNWIHVSKQDTFGDTDTLKDAVVASQKRIIRRQNMGLGLGEGSTFRPRISVNSIGRSAAC